MIAYCIVQNLPAVHKNIQILFKISKNFPETGTTPFQMLPNVLPSSWPPAVLPFTLSHFYLLIYLIFKSYSKYNKNITTLKRNSAVADKPHDAFREVSQGHQTR